MDIALLVMIAAFIFTVAYAIYKAKPDKCKDGGKHDDGEAELEGFFTVRYTCSKCGKSRIDILTY